MSMTAQDVVTRATLLLNDSGDASASLDANTRWTTDELLLWITDGERAIVVLAPNSNNAVVSVPLVAGTRQSIPPDGWILISVKRNLTASGGGARAIRQTVQALLDAYNPNWHTDPASPTVWNFMFDVEDHTAFYVYPPNDGTGHVELAYTQVPVECTALDQVLDIDDIYLPALANYVLYRALNKDAEYAGGSQLAQGYYSVFLQSCQAQEQSEQGDTPNSTFAQRLPAPPAQVPQGTGRK
jgi:hypothetical protein